MTGIFLEKITIGVIIAILSVLVLRIVIKVARSIINMFIGYKK